MDGQTSGTNETVDNQIQIDSWEAAFAALEPKTEEDDQAAANNESEQSATDGDSASGDTSGIDGQPSISDQDEDNDNDSSEGNPGGLDSDVGSSHQENGNAFSSMLNVTEESIKQFEEQTAGDIQQRAIKEVADEFIKRGIRNNNGVLGATLDDPDICKRDEDGVPRFYNPETGREFTGDNPRRQAQEWVDDYNKELARVFNNTCKQYEDHLMEEQAPRLAVMKFAPKYDKLDDIRKGMFDNVIEDYEIKDSNGDIIGYSCDLDKALALVERQVAMIQNYAKSHQPDPAKQPTGPALDMKTSGGVTTQNDQAMPSSLAEAMERQQDALLAKLKKY